MKHKVFLPVILLIGIVLLASCAIGPASQAATGSLSFLFPMGSLSREAGDETYLVRVFYGLDLYDQEPKIVGNEIEYSGLPLGEVWIFIARGIVGSDGYFYPTASGDIEKTIVGGENDSVTVTLTESPFEWSEDLKESNVVGLVELEGTVYAATDENELYKGTYSNDVFTTSSGPLVPDGIDVNSLSVGKVYDGADYIDQVWVNGSWSRTTGGGIMAWEAGGTLDTNFSEGFATKKNRKNGVVSDVDVLHSGAFVKPVNNGAAIFFQRDGGLGGVYLRSDPNEFAEPKDDWAWIVDEINFGELLEDVVEDTDDLILDLEVSSTTAYLVSSLITVKISDSILTATAVSVEDLMDTDIVAYAPEVGAPITDLDLDDTNDQIYIGTTNGLYVGKTSTAAGDFLLDGTDATVVSGTAGFSIEKVVSSQAGSYVAFITKRGDDPDLLSFIKVSGSTVKTYRTLQGLPGEDIQSLVWLDDGVLTIGGDRGLVAVDVSGEF